VAETYTVLVPEITSAAFSVNPVNMNSSTILSVTVTEKTIVLEPEKYYSGEFFSGEV
jgi:hypothetical protein